MFCMECGTKLPDGAKFCMNCGTRVGQVAAPAPAASPAPSFQPEKPKAPAVKKTMNCSMRYQLMVYVKGSGLFFTGDEQSISFLPEGEKRVKKAVRKSTKLMEIHALGLYDGNVYFWAYYEDEKPYRLIRLDPVTLEKTIVRSYDSCEISIGGDNRAALYGDSYYAVHHHYCDGEEVCDLVKISVLDGEITRRPTVDLNAKKMPVSWLQPNGYFLLDEDTGKVPERYRTQMDVFRAQNGYGYLSLSGGSPCTLRFPLDDPDQYEYLELDVCTAYDQGVLFQDGNTLYSGQVGLRETAFWATDVSGGQVGQSDMLLSLKNMRGLDQYGMHYWWQQDRRIYMKDFFFDMDQKKFIRMPGDFSYFGAADFIADDKGGCYVMSSRLYYFPKDWHKNRKELEEYFITDIK